jgi:hypothetical protein
MDEPFLTWSAAKKRSASFRLAKPTAIVCGVAIGIMILVLLAAYGDQTLQGDLIVIVPLFALGFLGIGYSLVDSLFSLKEPRFFCCHCSNPRKFLDQRTAWTCAYCSTINHPEENELYSFLKRKACKKCKKEPTGLRCPHCGNAFFLDQDQEEFRWAQIPGGSPKPPVPLAPPPPKPTPIPISERDKKLAKMRRELEGLLAEQAGPRIVLAAMKNDPKNSDILPEEWQKLENTLRGDELRLSIDIDTDE